MPTVQYLDHTCESLEKESVLDTLLRHGVEVPHSCKAGSCGSCMMRAEEGAIPERAQAGFRDSWKSRGYFLACVCEPACDLKVGPVGADARVPARIVRLGRLSGSVLLVRVRCDDTFAFRAGQFATMVRADGLARSYSIASLPEENELEFHVRSYPNGKMSGWLGAAAQTGDRVEILGPSGECFYVPGREHQPILMAGTGTGLAPLYGVLRDALQNGHRAPIHLFHGALSPDGLYLREELASLSRAHPNFEYAPTLRDEGPIDQVILQRFPKVAGWRGYVCGDPAVVQVLRKKLFLAGMAMRDIYADSFLPAAPGGRGTI